MAGDEEDQSDLFAEETPPAPAPPAAHVGATYGQYPPSGQYQSASAYLTSNQNGHPHLSQGQALFQPVPQVSAIGGGQGYGGGQLVVAARPEVQSWDPEKMVQLVVDSLTRVQGMGERKKRKLGVDDNDEEEEMVKVKFENLTIEDDGENFISWEARSLRPYTGPLEPFWARQPRVVRPLRESFDTAFLRMDPVNGSVTLRDHDRGLSELSSNTLK